MPENKFITRDELIERVLDLEDAEENERLHSETPTQWSILKNGEYSAAYPTVSTVPAGLYEIAWNSALSTHTLKQQDIVMDELYELPSPELKSIIEDIESFWDRSDTYKSYNFVHKRGILLYGDPGCGKSGIIQLCVKKLIDREGIVINLKEEDDIKSFSEFIPIIRKIEPNRPLIVILEDIDSLAGEDRYSTTKLLNILDGIKQVENVVYIATTNYPEKLQERITNRPSRFDRRYEVGMPSREIREAYIKSKLNNADLERIEITDWLDLTEGMSLSHLKELIISVIVLNKTFKESIQHLSDLKKKPKIKSSSNVGFKSSQY